MTLLLVHSQNGNCEMLDKLEQFALNVIVYPIRLVYVIFEFIGNYLVCKYHERKLAKNPPVF